MGADHVDLYYVDGSNPPSRILKKFLDTAENARGAIGVHCKALYFRASRAFATIEGLCHFSKRTP